MAIVPGSRTAWMSGLDGDKVGERLNDLIRGGACLGVSDRTELAGGDAVCRGCADWCLKLALTCKRAFPF